MKERECLGNDCEALVDVFCLKVFHPTTIILSVLAHLLTLIRKVTFTSPTMLHLSRPSHFLVDMSAHAAVFGLTGNLR